MHINIGKESFAQRLIISGMCQSQGDSGFPLQRSWHDGFPAGACYAHAVWMKRYNCAEKSGYPAPSASLSG